MIFTPALALKVADGSKWKTRRLVKPDEHLAHRGPEVFAVWRGMGVPTDQRRMRYVVGRDYAVQAGRGKPAICRVRITAIRRENIQDISEADVAAEGITHGLGFDMPYAAGQKAWINPHWIRGDENSLVPAGPRSEFAAVWDGIHPGTEERWYANPLVWVLTIERMA